MESTRIGRAETLLERLQKQGRLGGSKSAALLLLEDQASASMLVDGERYPSRLERFVLHASLGERGTIAWLCGDRALKIALREQLLKDGLDAGDVYARIDAYGPDARRIVREYAQKLALAVMSLIHLFDPERILLAGRAARLGALLTDPIDQTLREHCFFDEYADVELVDGDL